MCRILNSLSIVFHVFVLLGKQNSPAASALALPPSTSQFPSDMYGAPPQQQPAFAALPPSTTASVNPAFAQAPSQPPQHQMAPAAADPWGMASMTNALPPAQAPVAPPAVANPFGVAASAPFAAPAPPAVAPTLAANQDPFGAGPPPTQSGAISTSYGAAPASFGSPPPSTINGPPQAEFTPATQASSIGFASPMAQPFQQQLQETEAPPEEQQFEVQEPAPVEAVTPAPSSDPALLSMNVLSGQPQPLVTEVMANGANGTATGSMADQAYAKFANMDAFNLVQSKDTESRQNPFDAPSIGGGTTASNANASLAEMKKSKAPSEPKKSIMNTPTPVPGAMVLSNTQQGNFGGYGGVAGGMNTMGQQQPPTMGQPPPLQGAYGGMQQQQPSYSQPAYGMQAQAPPSQQQYGMQAPQGQYGQPPPLQQQQPAYGQQPPPLQQQPFGF